MKFDRCFGHEAVVGNFEKGMIGGAAQVQKLSGEGSTIVRTDEEMKLLLQAMTPPHHVMSSLAHGENNCLIDSILLALHSRGLLAPLSVQRRAEICRVVRRYVADVHGFTVQGHHQFLSHETHLHAVCQGLRAFGIDLWCPGVEPSRIGITVVAFDRSHRRTVQDVNGCAFELPEMHEPVRSAPPGHSNGVDDVVLQLYCNTHDDEHATPYHYEWIDIANVECDTAQTDGADSAGRDCWRGLGDPSAIVAASDSAAMLPPPAPFLSLQQRPRPLGRSSRSRFCGSYSGTPAAVCGREASPSTAAAEGSHVEDSHVEDSHDCSFFEVSVLSTSTFTTEQDDLQVRCARLAAELRDRPTLPPLPGDATVSWQDTGAGVRLPMYCCAFRGCAWSGETKNELVRHLSEAGHAGKIACVCGPGPAIDFYQEAIASLEREQVPKVGPSVDRRSLGLLVQDYNSRNIRSLVCFVCAQTHSATPGHHSAIEYHGRA